MSVRGILVAPVLVVWAGTAHAHGGVGSPLMGPVGPGPGVIQDAPDGHVDIHWTDLDPDDNASLALMYTPDPLDPSGPRPITAGLKEDCDPSDAGSVFSGVLDASVDASRPPQEELDQLYCRNTTGACTYEHDCYRWDTSSLPQGNYWVLGVLDDHWADGGGGAVSFRLSKGLVRVVPPGHNVQPALLFLEPDGVGDLTDTCYHVRWKDSDPDDNARIRLFLAPAFGEGTPPVLVADGLTEDDLEDGLDLSLRGAPNRVDLVLIAELDDGVNPPWRVRSDGYVTRYVRLLGDGGHAAHDGGCTGTAREWPDGSVWPVPDSGADGGALDGGARDAAVANDAGGGPQDAGGSQDGGRRPGCRPGSALATPGEWPWAGAVLGGLALRLVRRRG
ncbi:MAG: hypothetical protein HY904_02570 [Deltaproteobacteria bacterium]|nr:hypothetical protein [Deltaproteobacteria bacterium]